MFILNLKNLSEHQAAEEARRADESAANSAQSPITSPEE